MYAAIPHRSLNYMYIIINILVERVFTSCIFSAFSIYQPEQILALIRELCRLVLKLRILTASGLMWPLMAAVPLVDAGP